FSLRIASSKRAERVNVFLHDLIELVSSSAFSKPRFHYSSGTRTTGHMIGDFPRWLGHTT
ncbi:hypothetical protein CEXT_640081, partial [Caerostris extrusa]